MNEVRYNIQFEKLCDLLQLGEITDPPVAIKEGYLHRMYAVSTTKGKYAVKALNPQVMLRSNVMESLINSENIAKIAGKNIKVACAKTINNIVIHNIDGQYYIVFDFIVGKNLKQSEISEVNCEKMGNVLTALHMSDFTELNLTDDYSGEENVKNWNFYLQEGQRVNADWVGILSKNIKNLYKWNEEAINAAQFLKKGTVISHCDMDPKNVIWYENNPIIIDWESAGYIHPMLDLIETALYWSENADGKIDKNKFMIFINAYESKRGKLNTDWNTILNKCFSSKLDWLEYNLKRALRIECTDDTEQQMGAEQVTETIKDILRFNENKVVLLEWLNGGNA